MASDMRQRQRLTYFAGALGLLRVPFAADIAMLGKLARPAALVAVTLLAVACGRAKDDSLGGSENGGGLSGAGRTSSTGGASDGGNAGGSRASGGGDAFYNGEPGGDDAPFGGGVDDAGDGGLMFGGQPALLPSTWESLEQSARTAPTPIDLAAPPRSADFVPSLRPLGSPGWRDSQGDAFCHSLRFPTAPKLWADDDGVAVMTLGYCESALEAASFVCSMRPPEERDAGTDVRYNDGTGWRWVYGHPTELSGLAGIAGAKTLVISAREAGLAKLSLQGEIAPFFNGSASTNFIDPIGLPSGSVFVEMSSDEYQSIQEVSDTGATALGRWDGFPVNFVYAGNDEVLYYVRDHKFYVQAKNEEAALIPDAPLGQWSALTLDPSGGFWATNTQRVVHFDGEKWEFIGDLPGEGEFAGAATDGQDLYVATSFHLWKASRNGVEAIVEDYSLAFTAITASPSGEVFVAVRDGATKGDQCSGDFIAHWDGAEFHVF